MTKKKSVSYDGGPVGYKRPPADHQFKKGQKPPGSGRKKGNKNKRTIISDILAMKMTVIIDGKRKKVSADEALILRGYQRAFTGSVSDVVRFYDLVERLAPNEMREPLEVYFTRIDGDDW